MTAVNYNANPPALAIGSEVWADEIQIIDASAYDPVNSLGQGNMTLKEFMLQAYGGVGKAASGTQVVADGNIVQFATMDAAFGPTAYNCTLPADFDDITVTLGGIYEINFECDAHNGEEGDTLWTLRDDTVAITNGSATSQNSATAADFSMFKHVSIKVIAAVAAASVLDVAITCSSACTVTTKNVRFWVRRLGPSA